MNKKKGFTLIELLAIIVILAIIAVITVPIILNVIEDAKKGAAKDSAYGYNESIYKGFLKNLIIDNNKPLPNGVYVIDNTGKLVNSNGVVLNTNVSGTEPSEGWVELEKGQVVAYSLKFDNYVVTKYKDTEPTAVKNGEIAENAEAREARLEVERQAAAIATAKALATSQTGTTEIVEITEGWVAFINGELKAYSLKVTEGDYTYVVTDLDVDSNNSHAVADRTISDVASTTQAEQLIVSYKVDSYVKAALTANSSLTDETANSVSDMSGVTTYQPNSGWIHFNVESNTVSVVDYSLTYGTLTANYSSLTNGNYLSTFGAARNKPAIIAVGSEICYGPSNEQECFKIIKKDSNKILLFANYNLKKYTDNSTNPATVTYKQESSSPDTMRFSGPNYWDNSGLKIEYAKDINNNSASYSGNPYPYVYNLQGTDTNYVKPYVDGYVSNLKITYGLPSSATGRLLTYEEATDTSIFANSTARKNEKYYWLGSAYNSTAVWIVSTNGSIFDHGYTHGYGVRPVIEISTSDIQ